MKRVGRLSSHLVSSTGLASTISAGIEDARPATTTELDTAEVLISEDGHISRILLNRADKMNSVSIPMLKKLLKFYDALLQGSNSKTKVVVVQGSGPRPFCAGGDMIALYKDILRVGSVDKSFLIKSFFSLQNNLYPKVGQLFEKSAIVNIAIWDGIVIGSGIGLTGYGKIKIATEKTTVALPETRIGLFPDVGMSWLLGQMNTADPSMGIYIGLTGLRLSTDDVLFTGWATHFLPSTKIGSFLERLPRMLEAANRPSEVIDELIYSINERPIKYDPSKCHLLIHQNEIAHVFSKPTVNDMVLELISISSNEGNIYEDIQQQWAKKTLAILRAMCPTALVVSHEVILRNSRPGVTLEQAFRLEAGVMRKMYCRNDYLEGVRAYLVEKTNDPKWDPARIELVNESAVRKYFLE